jgi:hypothetical protein
MWSLLVAICLAAAGCRTVEPKEGLLEQTVQDSQLTSHQLRVLVNDYLLHYAIRVEQTADQILARTDDPTIRRSALLWKTNGIAAGFRAASRPDSLGAFLDSWILAKQSAQLFASPAGARMFGPWQTSVTQQCLEFDNRLREIEQMIGRELPLGEAFAIDFARDFPVENLFLDRESLSTRYIDQLQPEVKEAFEILGSLDENVTQLKKLVVVYGEFLPKHARWQSELFLLDSQNVPAVSRPVEALDSVALAAANLATTANTLPAIVAGEREALRQIVTDERTATLHEVDRMREATIADLQGERNLILDAVRSERQVLTETLSAEIAAVTRDADQITERRVEQWTANSRGLIDHTLTRLALPAALIGLTALLWSSRLVHRISRSGRRDERRSRRETLAINPATPDDDGHRAAA